MSHQILQADEWPLFEIRASHLNDRVRLHLSFDALTCDAFSKRLVFRDWGLLYENPETTLPPLQVTFRDYVLADAGLKDSDAYRRALEYWMARLDTLLIGQERKHLAVAPDDLARRRDHHGGVVYPALIDLEE